MRCRAWIKDRMVFVSKWRYKETSAKKQRIKQEYAAEKTDEREFILRSNRYYSQPTCDSYSHRGIDHHSNSSIPLEKQLSTDGESLGLQFKCCADFLRLGHIVTDSLYFSNERRNAHLLFSQRFSLLLRFRSQITIVSRSSYFALGDHRSSQRLLTSYVLCSCTAYSLKLAVQSDCIFFAVIVPQRVSIWIRISTVRTDQQSFSHIVYSNGTALLYPVDSDITSLRTDCPANNVSSTNSSQWSAESGHATQFIRVSQYSLLGVDCGRVWHALCPRCDYQSISCHSLVGVLGLDLLHLIGSNNGSTRDLLRSSTDKKLVRTTPTSLSSPSHCGNLLAQSLYIQLIVQWYAGLSPVELSLRENLKQKLILMCLFIDEYPFSMN